MMHNPDMNRTNEYELTDQNAIHSAEVVYYANNDSTVIDGMNDQQLRRASYQVNNNMNMSNNLVVIDQAFLPAQNNLSAASNVLAENKRSMDLARGIDPNTTTGDIRVDGGDDDDDENDEHEEEEEEDVGEHVNIFKRGGRYMKRTTIRFVRGTRYFLFHSDRKGRLYFCGNTLGFWLKSLLFLAVLYVFLFLFFVCIMQLASVIQGVPFIPFASNRSS